MTTLANKVLARTYFEDFLNRGDLVIADQLFATDCRFHYPLGELEGTDAIVHYIESFKSAFPKSHFTIEDLFGENDLVACRWTLVATQSGEFRGARPTGTSSVVPGNTIFRIAGNRIAQMWVAFNPGLLIAP